MTAFLLLVLSTLVSEDLACIAAGVLAASGHMSFATATLACFAGIFVGDMLLYGAGRIFGRRVLKLRWVQRYLPPERLEAASVWLATRGARVVFTSRFTPGMRLPVYVAAGLLRTDFARYTLYFVIAAAIWTPALIGATVWFGRNVVASSVAAGGQIAITGALAIGAMFGFRKLLVYKSRRRMLGFVLRKVRWEFWPMWAAYLPVVPYILYLALKHRSLTVFTAANPGIPAGGLAGESKSEILDQLAPSGAVARYTVVDGPVTTEFPVVLKPDVGERGSGVVIAHSAKELATCLRPGMILQEYVPGVEFGVFYYRFPGERHGRILSLTHKQFPFVIGDGVSTLEKLILADSRAVAIAAVYLARHPDAGTRVPAAEERVQLVNIGSHCRGAVFLDGSECITEALTTRVDEIARHFSGFHFGRFDVRSPSIEHVKRGEFLVLELNGVTSEPTHIYDPRVTLVGAYRAMFMQWRLAFEIGAANRALGYEPAGIGEIVRLLRLRSCSVSSGVKHTRRLRTATLGETTPV
jgi:membrane protein DedA with SNARE-associated domain